MELTSQQLEMLALVSREPVTKLFGTPREEWPAIVRAQVMAINSSMDRSPREGNETLFHFFPKLMYLADFPTEMRDRIENYAFDLAPDLRVLASVDNPQTVETLTTSERLRPFGGWAGAYPRLLDNLRALPAPHHVVQDRIHVWISADDDFYGATRVLILEELLAKVDDPFSEYGVLVVMPTRNLLGALVIRSFEDTVTGVSRLLNYAAGQFAQRPGPLVPHVYYQASANATLQQLTYPTDDKVQVHVTGAFETMISRLLPQ